jgi:hypothetical protein
MIISKTGSAGGERAARMRRLVVGCCIGFGSLVSLSCVQGATDTPTPAVDYKTLPQNPAFAANPSQAAATGMQAGDVSGAPTSASEPAAASGATPPTAAAAPGDASAPSSAGPAGVKPNAGTAGAGPSVGVAGTTVAGAAGTAAMGGSIAGAPATQPAAGRPTVLTLEFTTKTQKGKYAPKNVGAAWVETLNGKWIHTLYYWAGMPNDSHLTRYNAAGGPNYATSGAVAKALGLPAYTTKPPADVVAGPTLDMHKMHAGAMWNLKNMQAMEVPDGDYRVVIELTEVDATGKSQEVPFTKGPMPLEITMDFEFYPGVKLTLK